MFNPSQPARVSISVHLTLVLANRVMPERGRRNKLLFWEEK